MGVGSIISKSRKAVFLDRDGVLNRCVVRAGRPYPPAAAEDVEILPGVKAALIRLKAAGYLTIVVTNQPDVARGIQSKVAVERINDLLISRLPLDDILVCYHDEDAGCACRKPEAGMLLTAARSYDLDLCASFMIGDRWRDVEAGRRAGCRTIFVDYAYDEKQPWPPPDLRVYNLEEAAKWILQHDRSRKGA